MMFGVVAATKSKYATLAATRLLLVSVFLEVFFMLTFLLAYAHAGGYSFADVTQGATTQGGFA